MPNTLILNPSQARAVYDAMCALNNVGGKISVEVTPRISVKELDAGNVVIYERPTSDPVVRAESFASQAGFATAYSLS